MNDITKKENLKIKVDYLCMVADNYYAEDFILHVLDMSLEIFTCIRGHIPHKAYTTKYQLGGIKVLGGIPPNEDNLNGLGCYLDMSGSGCSDFFRMRHCEKYSGFLKNRYQLITALF